MSNWFSEKVGLLVREAAASGQQKLAAASREVRDAQIRTADELAAELEWQARRISSPQSAVELLLRWADQSDAGAATFPLGSSSAAAKSLLAEPLSFHQALLRSSALELIIESCGRVPLLRADLLRGTEPGAGRSEEKESMLDQAMREIAERLLLPGASTLWQGLLEVLVATGAEEAAERDKSSRPPVLESRCGPWARRALALMKRPWQSEALPAALRRLDRQLTALMTTGPGATPIVPTQEDPARSGSQLFGAQLSASRMSRSTIRAALAREQLRRLEEAAVRLRSRTELLCDACARLEVAEGSGATRLPAVESLLQDADEMLSGLDMGVKELNSDQTSLQQALQEVQGGLEKQIAEFQDTLTTFATKRSQLQAEKTAILRRLEELDMQLSQIDEATGSCERKSKQLASQLREATHHFEEKIAGSFCRQKYLADEKLRVVACKACAHTALDVVRNEERRRGAEVAAQLRRRRAELRRTCAAYLRQERLRMEGAAELQSLEAKGPTRVLPVIQETWQAVQDILHRVQPFLREQPIGRMDRGPELREVPEALPEAPVSSAAPLDAPTFFAAESLKGLSCIDCGLPDADWATVSYGAYLCVDCAGRHRGLGVHLSFVRSTTMDHWSPDQLRRMQIGGTDRLQSFFAVYPGLRELPTTRAALHSRYNSRAAAHYRRLLDGTLESREQPGADEGHLAAADAGPEDKGSPAKDDEDEEAKLGSLEQEQALLEATFQTYQRIGPAVPPEEQKVAARPRESS